MMTKHAKLVEGGRISIPSAMRKHLGLNIGDEVILDLDEDGLRIRSMSAAISRAQAAVRQYVDKSTSLSAELLDDRRQEAAHD